MVPKSLLFTFSFTLLVFLILPLITPVAEAATTPLINQVNKAHRQVYGKNPSQSEWAYWAGRIQKGEKKTYTALVGAMGYAKAQGSTPANSTSVSSASAPAASFKTSSKYYPSTGNPNFLPNGTLVKSPSDPNVYYIRNSKKSWVLPSILNRWLKEDHYFSHDIIITISASDLARYPQTSSVNQLYIGKVLKHPNGAQFYIDDKLRKRPLSASTRKALKFPGGNLYGVSAVHLKEFKTGPALKGSKQPGGMVIYDGPFHGGRMWRLEENSAGTITKRLYMNDHLYETSGYPDESQRVQVSSAELATYTRGPNIERYTDGWVANLNGSIYVVQNEKLRLITSPAVLNAMGYKQKNIIRAYSSLLKKYAKGQPIRAFKSVTDGNSSISKGAPAAAPTSTGNLTKVRPGIRSLIAQVNNIALPVYDRQINAAENKYWVDYLYNGQVDNKADLVAAMRRHKNSGAFPPRTSRTATVASEELKNKWFPYLFYFVHQSEPNDDDRAYWFNRIHGGDRDTIEKLGGTLQWLKDTSGLTHK